MRKATLRDYAKYWVTALKYVWQDTTTPDRSRISQANADTDTDRTVRVFVSSTFRDLVGERDALAKRTFPALRKYCEDHAITFTDVDLRWGVTDEEAAEGRVLELCLSEIERSRPFFIGILGERYGWVPDSLPASVVETQPWLAELERCSITEMEIVHGVLADPAVAGNAFFYFRDPDWNRSSLGERLAEDDEPREESRRQLAELKQRIRDSGIPFREGFTSAEQLAQMVYDDLSEAIGRRYSKASDLNPLDRERRIHGRFGSDQARDFVGKEDALDSMDQWFESEAESGFMLVTGGPGSGKSALLSAWLHGSASHGDGEPLVQRLSSDRPVVVFEHYSGVTEQSGDWERLGQRLCAELIRETQTLAEVPTAAWQLSRTVDDLFHNAAESTRLVIVIDAVNQLDEVGQELNWLPATLPPGVRVVVSTLPGISQDAMLTRRPKVIEVGPLTVIERRNLGVSYLGRFGKSLSEARLDEIIAGPIGGSPLYLRTVMDELRVWGDHSTLDDAVARYSQLSSFEELFAAVFGRWEQDYEKDYPGLVKDVMRWVWAAPGGATEVELLDLLGTKDLPFPHAHFAPLSFAMLQVLPLRAGFYNFAHEQIQLAAVARYLPAAEDQSGAMRDVAAYLRGRGPNGRSARDLLPLLARLGDIDGLYEVLSEPGFLKRAWEENPRAVRDGWIAVIEKSDHSLEMAYGRCLQDPKADGRLLEVIGRLMLWLGAVNRGCVYIQAAAKISSDSDAPALMMDAAEALAESRPDAAEELIRESIWRLRWRLSPSASIQVGMTSNILAQAAIARGEYDRALELAFRAGECADVTGWIRGVAESANTIATCFAHQNDETSRDIARRAALEAAKQSASMVTLGKVMLGMAEDVTSDGRFDEAAVLAQDAAEIIEDTDPIVLLPKALDLLDSIYRSAGRTDEAERLEVRRHHIRRLRERIASAAVPQDSLVRRASSGTKLAPNVTCGGSPLGGDSR